MILNAIPFHPPYSPPRHPLPKANTGNIWYNDTITGEPYRTYCTLCPATFACNSTGLTAPDVLCAEGYFCKLGSSAPQPYCQAGEGLCQYGICPEGNYCPTGTSDPISCPPGEGVRGSANNGRRGDERVSSVENIYKRLGTEFSGRMNPSVPVKCVRLAHIPHEFLNVRKNTT